MSRDLSLLAQQRRHASLKVFVSSKGTSVGLRWQMSFRGRLRGESAQFRVLRLSGPLLSAWEVYWGNTYSDASITCDGLFTLMHLCLWQHGRETCASYDLQGFSAISVVFMWKRSWISIMRLKMGNRIIHFTISVLHGLHASDGI